MDKNEVVNLLKAEKSELEKRFSIRLLALFGSYSRNQQTGDSDIDIAFEVANDKFFGFSQRLQLQEHLMGVFKKNVDLVRLKYMDPIIRMQVERDLIYV